MEKGTATYYIKICETCNEYCLVRSITKGLYCSTKCFVCNSTVKQKSSSIRKNFRHSQETKAVMSINNSEQLNCFLVLKEEDKDCEKMY